MKPVVRFLVRGIDVVNRRGKPLGARLVKVTGKRPSTYARRLTGTESWEAK